MVFRMNSPKESRQLPLSPPKLKCDSLMFRFPVRLWKIINACRSGAITWGPSGKTIRIDRSQFEAQYLTTHDKPFKTNRFSSFIRQLNLYGFKKVGAPIISYGEKIQYDDLYEYLHPNFRQGRSELLPYLQRNCKKSNPTTPSSHKGKTFKEIQQNVTCKLPFQEQLRAHFHTEESKVKSDEEQTLAEWTPKSGIENHPLLRPFNRTSTLLQSRSEIPPLPGQPSPTISGMIDQSSESRVGSRWPRQENHTTDHVEDHEETDIADKATIGGLCHSNVNLKRCKIDHEQSSITFHKKLAVESLQEFVENALDEK